MADGPAPHESYRQQGYDQTAYYPQTIQVRLSLSLWSANGILIGRRRDPDERATIPFAIPFRSRCTCLLGSLLSALLKLRIRPGNPAKGAIPKTDLQEMLVVYRDR
jgi:hypothetical protein